LITEDRNRLERILAALRPWLILAVVCAGFSLNPTFSRTFWTLRFLPNVLQQSATNIIIAVGMTFVIVTGGIDLSAGSVLAFCGVGLALTVTSGVTPLYAVAIALPVGAGVLFIGLRLRAGIKAGAAAAALAVPIAAFAIWRIAGNGIRLEWALAGALAVGACCGLVNGLGVAFGRVPPFIMTLGMLTAARGLTVAATNGNSVSGLPERLGGIGEGAPLVVIALATVVIGATILDLTQFGRSVRAIGGNEQAARLSGIDVPRIKLFAYVISGLCAAIAAVVLTAKFREADTGAGLGAELNGIAAVVIGGTPLTGGKGSVIGGMIGALTITVLNVGLVLIGVKDTLQGVVIGAVIIAAVMLDQLKSRER
jgi:ribose/xylose/arabinose/galactoside ABC-type transport system permease subunit